MPVSQVGMSMDVKDISMRKTEVKGSVCTGISGEKGEFPNSGIRS